MSTAICTEHRPVSDWEIEEWVHERYGFAPHPFWIDDCKELFLKEKQPEHLSKLWYICPPDKRLMIREAFVHFGLLPE